MERMCIKSKEQRKALRLRKWVVLGVIGMMAVVYMECRVNAIIAKANEDLVPIYVSQEEVVYGAELADVKDPADFTYEKEADEFIPIDCKLSVELQEYTWLLCKANNIDYSLVMALMKHESQYDASAVSTTNDYGLMQINKMNHEWLSEELGITDYLDEKQNINAGVYILGNLFEKYHDTNKVLMAYNMGETNARKCWKKGIYESKYSRIIAGYQVDIKAELETAN